MKKLLPLLLAWLVCGLLAAQSADETSQENLVPNPGFEEFSGIPIGWYYRGSHFTNVVRYWSSATAASPDAFGPKVRVPEQWAEKGFGDQIPRSGEAMAGITVYGCEEGKPHCREYIQVQLLEPLVIGQNYYIEFYVSHLLRSLQVNNIGAYFSEGIVDVKTDVPLEFEPMIYASQVVKADNHRWVKISGTFQATTEADYLILGNFYPDSLTTVQESMKNNLRFGYYYIDDVLLRKMPPILDVPLQPDDLSLIKVEEGGLFQLRNIFFDTDKYELLPRSYVELKKLLHIMEENPTLVIEVRGHTDSRGRDEYNSYLSRKRAQAVVNFLNENGIDPKRTHYVGFGSTQPVADNDTEEGRQQNRRVEFLILRK